MKTHTLEIKDFPLFGHDPKYLEFEKVLKRQLEERMALLDENEELHKHFERVRLERDELKAEVERLRDAGARLIKHGTYSPSQIHEFKWRDAVRDFWKAQKEGK